MSRRYRYRRRWRRRQESGLLAGAAVAAVAGVLLAGAGQQHARHRPGPPATVVGSVTTSGATSSGPVVRLGLSMAAARGWAGVQARCLNLLWTRESGWRADAQNPYSTAYGIAQFLDSTWADYGGVKTSDPAAQIRDGLAYIAARYGTPCAAWAHEQADGWY
jgi:ABC-type phosphate transport system substrate-binding protein